MDNLESTCRISCRSYRRGQIVTFRSSKVISETIASAGRKAVDLLSRDRLGEIHYSSQEDVMYTRLKITVSVDVQ